jgi:hypothetical protein
MDSFKACREKNGISAPAPLVPTGRASSISAEIEDVKAEPVDPLPMDMGHDEVDYEPGKINLWRRKEVHQTSKHDEIGSLKIYMLFRQRANVGILWQEDVHCSDSISMD